MVNISRRLPDLLRPSAFPHPAANVRLIETHISWIILAGEHAYKLRKPVNFGFLDFTTLEQRREDCAAEVALNRRLCSDLYLGVVDVVERADGSLSFGGGGTSVEPAVDMRRLPEAGMLPVILQRGNADEHLMQRIAQQLAQFHAAAATGPGVDEYGGAAVVRANWDENFAQVASSLLEPSKRTALQAYVTRFLEENATLFEERIASGRIRDGHGDLHAASVCATRRRLYLFDCIEFNARFRCGDVAAEVAFLAMDLEHLGRGDLASAFVDAYVRASDDVGLLQLLDFYKCYRAFVRGKVLTFRLSEPDLDPATFAQLASEAQAYFDLACACAFPPDRPALVVVMGARATGKTTLARALASRLGFIHVSSDATLRERAGVRHTLLHLDALEGETPTRASMRRAYAAMRRKATRWLRRGRSVVLDGTYGQRGERVAVRQLARRAKATVWFIVCRGCHSEARNEIWAAPRETFAEPTEIESLATVDTTLGIDSVVEQLVAEISTRQAQEVAA